MVRLFLFLLFITCVLDSNAEPLYFTQNKGQVTDQHFVTRSDIDYSLSTKGVTVFAGDGQLHYQFKQVHRGQVDFMERHNLDRQSYVDFYRMDMELVGANKNATAIEEQPIDYHERYYTQQFGNEGAVANCYQRITYSEIYPHIDWVLYIKDNQLEYEFVVKPGGNPADIKIKYSGATGLTLNADKSFTATTPMGSISEQKPYSYTSEKEIASAYRLQDNILSFDVAAYSGTLTIDPTVVWTIICCYSDKTDDIEGIDVGPQGYIYATGETNGNNIATTGAYQTIMAGALDIYLVKYDGSNTKIWATYFGGVEREQAYDVVYDGINAVYINGLTESPTGIASTGAFQQSYNADTMKAAALLAKFDLNGVRQWSTYYGDTGNVLWGNIACDNNGNAYIVGSTNATNNIASSGSHKTTLTGTYDGFLAKFNPNGTRLWATYYGGNNADNANGVACDNNNNVYLSGGSDSPNNIATPGTFQSTISGSSLGFLVKFNSNGVRQWGTYTDQARPVSVVCDNSGNLFIAGFADVPGNVATAGAYDETFGGSGGYGDGFLAKFDATGNRVWGTYIGSNNEEYLERVVCDAGGFLYVMGNTESYSGLATTNAYDATHDGGYDGAFAKFTSAGVPLWISYYGTSSTDACYDIAPDGLNTFYMCGLTGFVSEDGFLVKFSDNSAGVELVNGSNNTISVYPNPNGNNGIFNVSLSGISGSECVIVIVTNSLGAEVHRERHRVGGGITIDIQNEAAGVYLVKIVSSKGTNSAKLIKAK